MTCPLASVEVDWNVIVEGGGVVTDRTVTVEGVGVGAGVVLMTVQDDPNNVEN